MIRGKDNASLVAYSTVMTVNQQNSAKPPVIGLIPARLASTRLPNKPLAVIAGWPMIRHVWERARSAARIDEVAIATPDHEIVEVAASFGARAIMTSSAHRSGTDRLAEAAEIMGLPDEAIIINIQGDEPLLRPAAIEAVLAPLLEDAELPMASLMCPCPPPDRANPACVKVICALDGDALYFSRATVPYPRSAAPEATVMQHIGLYAYRRGFLRKFAAMSPTPLEKTESLEQLRVLEHGYRIRMIRVEEASVGVDTPEDLDRVRALIASLTDRSRPA